jgi:hypothetical protein
MTKTDVTIATINANLDKPFNEILELIVVAQAANGVTWTVNRARQNARWVIADGRTDMAADGVPTEKRGRKASAEPKAPKAPKVRKAKEVSVANVTTARKAKADKAVERIAAIVAPTAPIQSKTPAEIEEIRAANLARIREVHERMAAEGKLKTRKVAAEVEDENNDHPVFLTREEVEILV